MEKDELEGIVSNVYEAFNAGRETERLRCVRLCMLIHRGYEKDVHLNRSDRWAAGGSAAAVECAQRIEAGQQVD